MNYKSIFAAAALATLPAMASAAVFLVNDDDLTMIGPNQSDIYLFTVDTAAGDFNHTFNLVSNGTGAAAVSLTTTGAGFFNNLVATWRNATDNTVLSSVAVGAGTTTLYTTFADPNSLNQILSITWDSLGRGLPDFTFDGDVTITTEALAPVPLPAGMFLLGTALAGLGVARRKA